MVVMMGKGRWRMEFVGMLEQRGQMQSGDEKKNNTRCLVVLDWLLGRLLELGGPCARRWSDQTLKLQAVKAKDSSMSDPTRALSSSYKSCKKRQSMMISRHIVYVAYQ